MNKKAILGCGIPFVVGVGLVVAGGRTLLKTTPKAERSEAVTRGDVDIKVVETGTIEPLRKVEVKSKAGGRIEQLLVDEGAWVRRGQTLAIIDSQEVNSQVQALRAQLAGAQARLAAALKGTTFQVDQTRTGITQSERSVDAARARLRLAEAESKAQPTLTRQTIEIAQANLEAARDTVRVQQNALDLLVQSTHPQAVVSAQSAYDRAKSQVENAERAVNRQKSLVAKGFVAQSVVDQAQTDLDVALAQAREAKERVDRIKQTNSIEAESARNTLANARNRVREGEAQLTQARASALPLTRQQEVASARAALAEAEARLSGSRSGKTQDAIRGDEAVSARTQVDQIQSQLDELLVRQRDTTLTASMPGMVTKRYVEQGELITSAVSSFSSGTPVFQVSDMATMLVKINVNEVDIAKLKLSLPTEVTIDAAPGVVFGGRVRKVAPAAGGAAASSSGEGSSSGSGGGGQTVIRFPVQIRIDNADPRLKPGMSARCAIIVSRRRNVVRVPTYCVEGKGSKGSVLVVTTETKNGTKTEKTAKREVTLGLRGDTHVEVLDGLKAGERVRPNKFSGPPRKIIDIEAGPGG